MLLELLGVVFCLVVRTQRYLRMHNMECGPWQFEVYSELIVKFFEREITGAITYLPCFKLVPTTKRWQFPRCSKPLFQSEAKCVAMVKTHFYKKGSHLASFWKWEVIAYWGHRVASSTGDGTAISTVRGHLTHANVEPLRLCYFKTQIIRTPSGIESVTSRAAVKCSINWAGPAAVKKRF